MRFFLMALFILTTNAVWAQDTHAQAFRIVKVWNMERSRELQVQMVNHYTETGMIVNLMFAWGQPVTQKVFAYSLRSSQEIAPPFTPVEVQELTLKLLTNPFTADVTIYPSRDAVMSARVSIHLEKYKTQGAYWLLTDGVEPVKELFAAHLSFAVDNLNASLEREARSQCRALFSL